MAKKSDNIFVKCPDCKTKFVRPRSSLGQAEPCSICGPEADRSPHLVKMVEWKPKEKPKK